MARKITAVSELGELCRHDWRHCFEGDVLPGVGLLDTVGPTRGTMDVPSPKVNWASWERREEAVSVYRVIDVIGTSADSWEDAAATAVNTARQSLRDMRIAEVVAQDLQLGEDGEITYRTKLRISFKYEGGQ